MVVVYVASATGRKTTSVRYIPARGASHFGRASADVEGRDVEGRAARRVI